MKVRGSPGVSNNSIDAISVISAGVPASIGDVNGGVVTITTKGPSSTYGGSVELATSEILDDYGCYMTYGEAVNSREMRQNRYLPEGLVEGCTLLKDVPQDQVLTYDDVTLPPNRLADRLRDEQYLHFPIPEHASVG